MKAPTRRRYLHPVLAIGTAALIGAAALTAGGGAANATSVQKSSSASCANLGSQSRVGHVGGIVHATAVNTDCGRSTTSDAAIGTPPLIFNGGPVMGTRSTGPVVVTPIFWTPSGHSMSGSYKSILKTYLHDVAEDSGKRTNVYSTLNEYYGSNGRIRYKIALGNPVNDNGPLPADGCTLDSADTTNIYADKSGYDACLDDDQIIAETERVVTARGLPRDYGHIYVLFLPKHVQSCFFSGTTTTADNFCTINHQPSAAYCAYHSQAPSGAVYANMPFPIYSSPVGYTCGTEKDFGSIQSPNGNPDADVQVSPTSHEIMEAITDPDTVTGWYDSNGYENGDECAYVFGSTRGHSGRLYNQVINEHRYLTQEEFSNNDFARTGDGCLQHT